MSIGESQIGDTSPLKKPKRVAYVTNKDLLVEMRKLKENGKMSNELGVMVLKIANRYSSKPCFSGYTYKNEMVGDAVMTVCMYIHNFNEEKSNNPFAYITQIVHNAFISRINKEKKISVTKQTLYDDHLQDCNRLDKFAEKVLEE